MFALRKKIGAQSKNHDDDRGRALSSYMAVQHVLGAKL
jgi:hypothetical protein